MNFIKKIFEDKTDDIVHQQFIRFGKGSYERALLTIKKSKKLSIKSSYEFSNDFVELIAREAKSNIEISGVIICDHDFSLDIENEYAKRGKMHKAEIRKQDITKEKLKEIYEKFKNDAMLLTLRAENCTLSCKTSLPKPGSSLKDSFCSASFDNLDVAKEFAFDVPDFKKLTIRHVYEIDDIIVPREYEDDFLKARLNAKRKGKIIRILNIDGKEIKKEHDLLA